MRMMNLRPSFCVHLLVSNHNVSQDQSIPYRLRIFLKIHHEHAAYLLLYADDQGDTSRLPYDKLS